MAEPKATRKCPQSGCTFGEDGLCMEGISPPETCPHLTSPEAPTESGSPEDSEEESVPRNWIPLPSGRELTADQTSTLTAHYQIRLVVLAGEPDAGKTTLISSLHQHFSEGPYADCLFAGSQTLMALERICHLSRTGSDSEKADTDRTKWLEPHFLHFELLQKGQTVSRHLLITDLSGEAYKRARNDSTDAAKLTFIKRCDAFVLLLDGEKLSLPSQRQEVLARGLMVLRSLDEAGVLARSARITVAISKFDLLKPHLEDRNMKDFLITLKTRLREFSSGKHTDFKITEIASRPASDSDLAFGYNVDKLFVEWLADLTGVVEPEHFPKDAPPEGIRESQAYLWRKRVTSDA